MHLLNDHVNIIVPINGKGQEHFCLNLHVVNSVNIHKYDVMILSIVIQYWYFYKTSQPFIKCWWLASFLYVGDLFMNYCTYFFSKKKISFKSNWNNNQILFSISEVLPFWLTTRSAIMGRILSRTTWWKSATSWGCWDIPSRTDMVVVTKSEGEIDPEKTQTEFIETLAIAEYTVWRKDKPCEKHTDGIHEDNHRIHSLKVMYIL